MDDMQSAQLRYQRALGSRLSLLGRRQHEIQAFAAQAALQAGQIASLCEQAALAGQAAAGNGDTFDADKIEEIDAAMEAALRVASQRISLRAEFLGFGSVPELNDWERAVMGPPEPTVEA